ncbi:MAG: FtsX-like permease family protein [Chloroflexi bacterium]|nr:FtsX-like permease family protein [Chloroflexota bacterium]
MNLIESIRIALRGLSVNKLRSALTMLGIIIGVGAVITLMSVGQGVQVLITEELQSVGTNLLFVMPGQFSNSGARPRTGSGSASLTLADAAAIADPFHVPSAMKVAPELMASADVSYGRQDLRIQVSGVTPDYSVVRKFPVDFGAFFSETDMNAQARVAVLGSSTYERLFGASIYPIGEIIKINGIPFKVIGVLQSKGGASGGNRDDIVLVPLTTAHQRLFPRYRTNRGEPRLSVIYVEVISEDRMDRAADEVTTLLRHRHGIRFGADDDFTVISQKDLLAIFGEITGVLTIFLGAIAGISLLVGGIGIMNIMLVSVTERTREIGLRKAVGARRKDILAQFLVEAIVLALIGGFIGILLGASGAAAISRLQDDLKAVLTPQSVLLATGFSAAVGLFFGIYPATRAARLNPIEALRYE